MASSSSSDGGAVQKTQRDRSPAYPFISLRAAVERVTAFEAKFGRHPAPLPMAGLAWGYKGDSSQAAQTLSTLRYFGLVEYAGTTDKRVAALTEDARNLLRAQQASTRAEILRVSALRPKAMQRYWEMWNADRPPDEVCFDQLVIKDSFTEAAAKTFLRVYDETIEYAGLTKSDNIDSVDVSQGGGGQDDVEEEAPAQPLAEKPLRERSPAALASRVPAKEKGMRQEVFSLSEGDVTIQWPETLSPDSFQDFNDWLTILLRKVKRSVAVAAAVDQPSDGRPIAQDAVAEEPRPRRRPLPESLRQDDEQE